MLGPAFTDGYEAQSQIREDIRNGDLLKSMETFWKTCPRCGVTSMPPDHAATNDGHWVHTMEYEFAELEHSGSLSRSET